MKRRTFSVVAVALLALVLSGCVGAGVPVPEFDRAQVSADALPNSEAFDATPYNAESSRFIAEQSGWDIFIARTTGDENSRENCLLLFNGNSNLAQCDDALPLSIRPDGETFTISLAGPQGPKDSKSISDSVYITN